MLFSQVKALTTTVLAISFDCKLNLLNDKFDLNSLNGVHTFDISNLTPPTITKSIYSISLCSPLPLPPNPTSDDFPSGTYIGLKVINQRSGLDDRITQVIPIVSENNDMNPSASLVEGSKNANEKWMLNMGGGIYNDLKQVVMIEMICQGGAKETAPTLINYDKEKGLLNLKWITIAACSTTSSTPPPTTPSEPDTNLPGKTPIGESDSSWGFFSYFFTLFFLTLIIYFVGGTYYNYSQFGIVEIPHKEVWQDLPYIAADLFKGRGGSRNGYNSLG